MTSCLCEYKALVNAYKCEITVKSHFLFVNGYKISFRALEIDMEITNDEITYVATLARLDIDKTSVEELASQMGKILGYVDTLKTLDTTGVPATTHASFLTNVFREDIVKESLDVDDALQNAPKSEDGYFIVPKVI